MSAPPPEQHPVFAGAEPWSHTAGTGAPGALCLHGFTGNPGSMRGVAEAFAAAGFHVELPRLPGHGTHVDDMLPTRWEHWTAAVEAAYAVLAARAERIVVAGLSMGGSLTLWLASRHPEVRGLVCINPATRSQAPEVLAMFEQFLADGTEVIPGIGSDIADPTVRETAYEGTPVRPLISLMGGLSEIAPTYPSLTMPMLLLGSPQDHVVEPAQVDYLASVYGGPVERVVLERSYHVATLDYDKQLIVERSVEFARKVTA